MTEIERQALDALVAWRKAGPVSFTIGDRRFAYLIPAQGNVRELEDKFIVAADLLIAEREAR